MRMVNLMNQLQAARNGTAPVAAAPTFESMPGLPGMSHPQATAMPGMSSSTPSMDEMMQMMNDMMVMMDGMAINNMPDSMSGMSTPAPSMDQMMQMMDEMMNMMDNMMEMDMGMPDM